MDKIDEAIRSGRHINLKYPEINSDTWEGFYKDAKEKKVVLFSIDIETTNCLEQYGAFVSKVVDNDPRKWGVETKSLMYNSGKFAMGNIKAESPEAILECAAEDTVIMISSIRYYEDIIEQVKNLGNYKCYVLLALEANRRSQAGYQELEDPDFLLAKRFSKEPIESNKILFYDYGTYSGHGKYISEKLLASGKDIDIVWAVRDPKTTVPEGMRVVYIWDRENYIREVETAKIWVFDYVLPTFFIKRPEQIYINVKHWASITLKTFGLVMEKRQERNREDQFIKNGEKMDYVIVGSDFDKESCRSGYAFNGEFLNFGSSRSDILFNEKFCRKKIYTHYGIDEDVKLLLYAPTFRYISKGVLSHRIQIDLDFEKIAGILESSFGGKWKILLRLHPNVMKDAHKINKPDCVIDVSTYPDSQELTGACDMMVTDYSSIMFEPAFVKKPVFLFATDLEEYLKEERDLLLDYKSLPFPIAHTHKKLEENLQQFNYESYVSGLESFFEKYGVHEDGHASERAAEFIAGLLNC